jgi:integrase
MGRSRSPGLRRRGRIWHIEKQVRGVGRICESTGTIDLEEAQRYLAKRMEDIRQATVYGVRPKRSFREAATKYLLEHQHKASIACDALFFRQLDPYIGDLPLERVHDGTLRRFVEDRLKDGRKTKTVNLALSAVRRVLNLAARKWRDEYGLTWLQTAPLISMLPVTDMRVPYPLSWEEQQLLFQELPAHLARMALFKVNTGTRDQEVCGLRWDWEVRIPELDTSVFLIPGKFVKNREDRVVVLNAVARRVIDEVRGMHPYYVFIYQGNAVETMHNSGWQAARARAAKKYQAEFDEPAPEGFKNIRVHDLKHTFGRRLRAAGVSLETRKVLLGHTTGDITSHYSAPELHELIEAVNRVCAGDSGKTPALTLIKTKAAR